MRKVSSLINGIVSGLKFTAMLAAAMVLFGSAAPAQPVEIPFAFEHNKIFIDNVYVKDIGPFRAILDTGTSEVILDLEVAKKAGMQPFGKTTANATGGPIQALKYKSPEIRIGKTPVIAEGTTIMAAPMQDQADQMEEHTDLILGYPLFRRNVVEIDFEKQKLRIYPAAEFKPPEKATALNINLSRYIPVFQAFVEGATATVILDTASNSAVDTYPEFMARNGFIDTHKLYEMPVYGMGGTSLTKLLRMKSLKIGAWEFKDFKAYSHNTMLYSGVDGLVGNEILRRFRVTVDYSRGKVYLEPAAAMNDSWEEERAGMVALNAKGQYLIVTIVTGGPAQQAGLAIGDSIIKINSKPAAEVGISGLRELVREKAGTKITMTVTRGEDGKQADVAMTLQDYVK